jgi:uncharacterized membrane protein YdbT with pleckstrin-like domain
MLFLLKGRYAAAARIVIGIVLAVVGIAVHAPALILVGGLLIVWGIVAAVSGWRGRARQVRKSGRAL